MRHTPAKASATGAKPTNGKGMCKFEHCENPIRHATLGICFRCYSYLLKWRDRNPQEKRERKQQLMSLNERMEYMMVAAGPMPKKAKRRAK